MTVVVAPGGGKIERYMQQQWARPLALRLQRIGSIRELFSADRAGLDACLPYPGNLLYVGHGNADALGDPALLDATNVARVQGMIAAIACRSAQRLGHLATAAGQRIYVGFIDDLHVIGAQVLDELVVNHFGPLLTHEWSVAEFETRFTSACQAVQDAHFYGRRRRARDAHLIGSAAQLMKLAVRVLPEPARSQPEASTPARWS